jgi:anti-sigma B factor antagonist
VLPQTPVAEKTVRRSSVAVELVEDHVVVTPAGELDLAVQSDLIGAYQDAIALQVEPRIVVDLCRVTFMDSTALGTLVAAAKKVKARGGTLSVVGANDRIASLFTSRSSTP